MAEIYAHASVEGKTVFEGTYPQALGVPRERIFIKARYAVEQFISIHYNLSEDGEILLFDTMNEDEELSYMALGYAESWISKDGLVSIVLELEEDGD